MFEFDRGGGAANANGVARRWFMQQCGVGLGAVASGDRADVELRWPDGLRERFDIDCLDCEVVLSRGDGETLP